jgi:hypothetical protein
LTELECRSPERALSSLAGVLGIDAAQLRASLEQERVDTAFTRDLAQFGYDELVWARIVARLGGDVGAQAQVVWFHATRVPRDTPFQRRGLLPLKDCLGGLRQRVEHLARTLRIPLGTGVANGSYCSKLAALERQGPCAVLLRDAALGQGKTRNFLKAPEIVEDLAEAVGGARAADILAEYQRTTLPCLVTFRTQDSRTALARAALAYCHAWLHGDEDPLFWNRCFDGQGQAVPPSDLLSVEWLDG